MNNDNTAQQHTAEAAEQSFRDDLHRYLVSAGRVDGRLPEAPDL